VRTVTRQEVVDRLAGLRRELETDGALDITQALLLSDVCDALGLGTREREAVLSWDVARTVDKWQLTQVWPIEEKETATVPFTEVAAVPVAGS
jgi:hypothetical protein